MHEASKEDIQMLEMAIAYMETPLCARWFYPMESWTATRVLLILVHGGAVRDPRTTEYDYGGFRDLIPHVTPHRRDPEPFDMSSTIAGLARLAKEFFPMVRLDLYLCTWKLLTVFQKLFHYRRIYYGEHTKAMSIMFNVSVWSDAGIQTTQSETESATKEPTEDTVEDAMEVVKDELQDVYLTDVHQAEDPREPHDICITGANLPYLTSYGVLVQIPLP